MISLVRLDERLIHGQIATKWSKHTHATHIVVADDDAASSKIIQKTLMMAAPGNIKTIIKPVEDAITLLKDERCKPLTILVLVKNPWSLYKLLNEVGGIDQVNIGNYGRVEPEHEGYVRKSYGQNLYIDDLEKQEFNKIVQFDKNIFYQTMPEDKAENLKELINS